MPGEAMEECTDEDEVLLVCLFLCFSVFLLTFRCFLDVRCLSVRYCYHQNAIVLSYSALMTLHSFAHICPGLSYTVLVGSRAESCDHSYRSGGARVL